MSYDVQDWQTDLRDYVLAVFKGKETGLCCTVLGSLLELVIIDTFDSTEKRKLFVEFLCQDLMERVTNQDIVTEILKKE